MPQVFVCISSPNGEQQWCRVDYQSIVPNKSFTAADAFCDAEGNKTTDMPGMYRKNEFSKTETGTKKVTVEITFSSEADLEKIIECALRKALQQRVTISMNC